MCVHTTRLNVLPGPIISGHRFHRNRPYEQRDVGSSIQLVVESRLELSEERQHLDIYAPEGAADPAGPLAVHWHRDTSSPNYLAS